MRNERARTVGGDLDRQRRRWLRAAATAAVAAIAAVAGTPEVGQAKPPSSGAGTASAAPPAAASAKASSPGTTVAILYFDYAGKDETLTPLSKGLAQMLISDLDGVPALRLVERERLEAVLAEQKLAGTGKLDPRTTARLGKLLGARYLVLGSYFDVLRALRVDARLVDVETGEVVKSVGENGKPDDFLGVEQGLVGKLRAALEPVLAKGSAGNHGSHEDGGHEAPSKRPPPKAPRRLPTGTALAYGRALGAMDAGRRDEARGLLRQVVHDQPDFELAQRSLDRLIQ